MSVLSFLFTASLSSAVIVVGPGDFAARALTTVLLSPIVWGLAMFYCYWDEIRWRPAALLGLGSLASAAVVTLFEVSI
jgi:hypothetical protein